MDELSVDIDEEVVYHDLDEHINKFGGIPFIEHLLTQTEYSSEFGRLIIPNSSSSLPSLSPIVYDLPYNFLFNLALKNSSSAGTSKYHNEVYFKETLDLASLFCYALYEVQTLSIWENIYHHDKDQLSYIRDLIFRESIFDIHQSSSKFIFSFIRFIRKKERAFDTKYSNDFLIVIYFLLKDAKSNQFRELNLDSIKKSCKYITPDISHILDKISISVREVNNGFLSPTDYNKVNYWSFPLLKMDNGSYLMLPASILSRCCLEAYLAHLREKIKDFDAWLGTVIEEFTYNLFNRKGIRVITGEFSFKSMSDGKEEKINGECDGLIEFDKEIILMEIKKKSLVRTSRSGDDAQILTDLGATLLASQVQGLKTQLALSMGDIVLTEKDHSETIQLNSRNIYRWTITMLPFGALQDKSTVEEILKIFTLTDFEYYLGDENQLTDSQKEMHRKKKKQIEKVSKLQYEFRKYTEILKLKRPFIRISFFDIEKIFYILRYGSSIDKIIEILSKLRHISFGTLDFYKELPLLIKE